MTSRTTNRDLRAWFAFRAWNSQTTYGYGTAEDADLYTDLVLNKDREVNLYGAYRLVAKEVKALGLDDGSGDGFDIDIEAENAQE